MGKLLYIIKIIFSTLFILAILLICYLLLASPKEKRFLFAEHAQGMFLSQKIFDILIFQNPDYSDAYFEKSVAYNKRGDYEKGFELLDKAVDINPESHLGYRGWLKLDKIRDYQGCIDDLTRLDTLTPNFVDAPWGDNIYHLLGLSYKGLKNYDEALKNFDACINSAKDTSWVNTDVFLYKGIILNELGNYEKAIENFKVCLKLSNDDSEAYYNLGKSYAGLDSLKEAKIYFNKSLELFKKGHRRRDYYNELPNQLYLSDINDQLKKLELLLSKKEIVK